MAPLLALLALLTLTGGGSVAVSGAASGAARGSASPPLLGIRFRSTDLLGTSVAADVVSYQGGGDGVVSDPALVATLLETDGCLGALTRDGDCLARRSRYWTRWDEAAGVLRVLQQPLHKDPLPEAVAPGRRLRAGAGGRLEAPKGVTAEGAAAFAPTVYTVEVSSGAVTRNEVQMQAAGLPTEGSDGVRGADFNVAKGAWTVTWLRGGVGTIDAATGAVALRSAGALDEAALAAGYFLSTEMATLGADDTLWVLGRKVYCDDQQHDSPPFLPHNDTEIGSYACEQTLFSVDLSEDGAPGVARATIDWNSAEMRDVILPSGKQWPRLHYHAPSQSLVTAVADSRGITIATVGVNATAGDGGVLPKVAFQPLWTSYNTSVFPPTYRTVFFDNHQEYSSSGEQPPEPSVLTSDGSLVIKVVEGQQFLWEFDVGAALARGCAGQRPNNCASMVGEWLLGNRLHSKKGEVAWLAQGP